MELRGAQDRKRYTAVGNDALGLELALVVGKRDSIDADDRHVDEVLHAGRARNIHETLRTIDVNRPRVPRIARRVDDDIDARSSFAQSGACAEIADCARQRSLHPTQDPDGMPGCRKQRNEFATQPAAAASDEEFQLDAGSLNAISSPLYPAPLTATTMYWRPLSM